MLTIKPKITITKQNESFVKQNEKLITSWLLSKKFHSQYLANPGYSNFPPLLDPDSIDFAKTDPQMAWELNLPLPNIFKFVIFGSHGCGNTGLAAFLRLCGGREILFDEVQNADAFYAYCKMYNELINFNVNKKESFCFLNIRNFIDNEMGKKFYSLIQSKNSLMMVRDPIEAMIHYMNWRRFKNNSAKGDLCLNFAEFSNLEDKILQKEINKKLNEILKDYVSFAQGWFLYDKEPNVYSAAFWAQFRYMCYHDGLLGTHLMNLNRPKIIDMSEILGKNALNTITKLAKEFDFTPPSENCSSLFSLKVSDFRIYLPFKILTKNGEITINAIFDAQELAQKGENLGCEISDILGLKEFHNNKFMAFIENKNKRNLIAKSHNLAALRKFVAEVLLSLEQIAKNTKKVPKEQLLKLFAENKDFCAGFYKITNQHLLYVRAYAPQIAQKWKYYNEFLKICKDFKID